jgi:eukaryotic-like serine/threonine-protein kinase
MGVVYVAEQIQPVRRKVALKIIKPGMDTKQVIARFEAERQALALMDHPNIAKVHDAGTTESGHPYFVMELVRGIPITEYCDRERLAIPERLELFVLVCRAVQHAHQKGIIHRDLKPSNILVTVIDGAAVSKIIDFGVAKATGASLTERTLYTAFQQFVGTPLYMSPEQAGLAGVDVDTRSDIYALGVLLYELLTGTTPFDQETLRQAAFDEVRRIIREQEPPKPSTRLSSLGATRTTVSANRRADARHLDRAVRGELDWIVMKSLEKDRHRRYETANDFAADVMRYLTDRPVEACPPSVWYRFWKFARRNRVALSTGALVVIALVAGTAVSIWQAVRATMAERESRRQSAMARKAVDEMYTRVADGWLAHQPHMTLVQRDFLENASAFYQEFAAGQSKDPGLRHETAEAAIRLGLIREKLGRHAEAEAAYRKAVTLEEELVGRHPDSPEYQRRLSRALHRLGDALRKDTSRLAESERLFRRSLAIREKLAQRFPGEADHQRDLAGGYLNLGLLFEATDRRAEAEGAFHKAKDIFEALVREPVVQVEDREGLAKTFLDLGVVLHNTGRLPEAEAACSRSIELKKKIVAEFPDRPEYQYTLAKSCVTHGAVEIDRKQYADAVRTGKEAVRLFERLVNNYPAVPEYRMDFACSHTNLGVALRKVGSHREADATFRRAREISEGLATDFPGVPEYQ